ncbi:MAG: hypothetical protein EOO39_33905, partial [Cytophagaceae bacterium]
TPEWAVFEALFRLPKEQRPTAVLCVNDHTAMNVCRRLLQLGLQVPEDIELTGFDDNCSVLPNGVGLTTVAQPFEQIGSAAAEVFLRRYASQGDNLLASRHIELPARLIIRGSTGESGVSAFLHKMRVAPKNVEID